MSVVVEIAFGLPPGSVPAEEDWVDVTEDLDLTVSSTPVRAVSGRSGAGTAIRPGSCEFSLISHAGKYDPRNADGEHFGDLINGVPVRVRMGSELSTRWTGTLRSGWPQQLTVADPVLEMVAEDTLGLGATAPMPVSAWDAHIAALDPQPAAWWRCGADGWICQRTGRTARHTSGLIAVPALVDGGDEAHRSTDLGEGRGVSESAPFVIVAPGDPFAVSMWVRLEKPEIPTDRMSTLLHQLDEFGGTQIKVQFDPVSRRMRITMANYYGGWRWWTPSDDRVPLFDGRSHHLMIDGGFDVDLGETSDVPFVARLHIDGKEVRLTAYEDEEVGPTEWDGALMLLGGGRNDIAGETDAEEGHRVLNAIGAVDHVMIWNDHPWLDDRRHVAQISRALTAAGRLAWAGERLDQRFANLATASGLGELLGDMDTSGIITAQGYRTGGLLDLLARVEDTEQGRISCDAEGRLRFSRRQWAWTDTRSTTVQATFSDVPAELDTGAFEMELAGTVIEDTPDGVINRAEVTSANGRMQAAEDAGSIAIHGRTEPATLTGLLHSSDRASLSLAQWIVLSQSEAQIRVSQLRFDIATDAGIEAFAKTVAEGDLVRVIKAPAVDCDGADVGEPVTIDAHVVGMEFEFMLHRTLVTLTLDSTRCGYEWFTWGESEWGGEHGWAF